MGALCCCPCGEDYDDYAHPSNSIYRHCLCLRYLFHQLCSGTFQRLDNRAASLPVQGATSLTTGLGTASSEGPTSVTYPRPASYDTDPRYTRLQRDGLIFRREKSLTHIQDDIPLLRRNGSSSGMENIVSGPKRNNVDSEEEEKTLRTLSAKAFGMGYILSTSEDEDVCPTCLEEYTTENPKIATKCNHHFHLGCIYEWMERSESCPICGKEMEFYESP